LNIDLGSPALDIAVSLSFVFFLLSLIASALTEGWAWFRNLRAKNLREGLEGMLGDPVLVDKILKHPLIRTELARDGTDKTPAFAPQADAADAPPEKERGPSYIAPRNFAMAFKAERGAELERAQDRAEFLEDEDVVGRQLSALGLSSETLSGADAKATDETLEEWFEDAMDRVNGWYKRHAQVVTLVIAAIIAFGLNASTVRIVERLDKEPAVRATLVAQAEAAEGPAKVEETSLKEAAQAASGAYDKVDALKLPIMWAGENVPTSLAAILSTILGCLVTTAAISLGAPFWFDTLSKLSNLRAAGKKPEADAKAPA
jgi:hypothetical protein